MVCCWTWDEEIEIHIFGILLHWLLEISAVLFIGVFLWVILPSWAFPKAASGKAGREYSVNAFTILHFIQIKRKDIL